MYYVYIMASRPGGAIYIGMSNDLRRRVEEHRAGSALAHTAKYRIRTLVWFESHDTLEAALTRERQIKRWRRVWKDNLIMERNPQWQDLTGDIPL